MQEIPEVQVVDDTEQSLPVQSEHKPIAALPDNSSQAERNFSGDITNTLASSTLAQQPELMNRDKTYTISESNLDNLLNARPQLGYSSSNQMHNHLSSGRFNSIPFSSYNIGGTEQTTSAYESLCGSANSAYSQNDLKTCTQYVPCHPAYLERYRPASMVAGATIYARNCYPSSTQYYRNEQLPGRMTYDRRFDNRAMTGMPASVLGGL